MAYATSSLNGPLALCKKANIAQGTASAMEVNYTCMTSRHYSQSVKSFVNYCLPASTPCPSSFCTSYAVGGLSCVRKARSCINLDVQEGCPLVLRILTSVALVGDEVSLPNNQNKQ